MRFIRNPYIWMGLGIAIIVVMQMSTPKPISWDYTYEANDKNPNGGWIPAHYMERSFPGKMKTVRSAVWSRASLDEMPTAHDSYVVITHEFQPDREARHKLLELLKNGGTLFVAASEIDDSLAKEIGIKTRSVFNLDSLRFFADTSYQSIALGLFGHANTFKAADSNTWRSLASCDSFVVLATRRWGKGSLILCGTPDLLTNRVFLDTALRGIPVALLSALPDKPIAWDEYYKPKRRTEMTVNKAIGSIPGLSLAYWILICTGVVYLLMAGRRRQRPIPVIPPVRNTSLDFVSTVGRLYYGRRDNLNLANKLTRLFRDHIVNRLRLRLDVDEQTLADTISNVSGADILVVNNILRRIAQADSGLEFSDDETVAFHNDILLFQQQSTI